MPGHISMRVGWLAGEQSFAEFIEPGTIVVGIATFEGFLVALVLVRDP
jgi:hypothetical protein